MSEANSRCNDYMLGNPRKNMLPSMTTKTRRHLLTPKCCLRFEPRGRGHQRVLTTAHHKSVCLCLCRHCCHLGLRRATVRKANAPLGVEEDTNDCIGRLQQRSARELDNGTSKECACHQHWHYRRWHMPPRLRGRQEMDKQYILSSQGGVLSHAMGFGWSPGINKDLINDGNE